MILKLVARAGVVLLGIILEKYEFLRIFVIGNLKVDFQIEIIQTFALNLSPLIYRFKFFKNSHKSLLKSF